MYRSRQARKKYNPKKTYKRLSDGVQPCPFCDIPSSDKVQQGKHHTVIKNNFGYQYWEGMDVVDHLMIVPKKHTETLNDLNLDEQSELIKIIAEYDKNGYNMYAREQKNAMKSVPHYHVHLIKIKNKRPFVYLHIRKPYVVIKK